MRGTRKKSGRHIYIPAETPSEASLRRAEAVRRLNEIKSLQRDLATELVEASTELNSLNRQIRSNTYEVFSEERFDNED